MELIAALIAIFTIVYFVELIVLNKLRIASKHYQDFLIVTAITYLTWYFNLV